MQVGGLMQIHFIHFKDKTMKQYRKIAVGTVASLGLALVVATAFAQSESMGPGKGHIMGMQGGMPGMMPAGMHDGMQGGSAGQMGGQQLMPPQEREALAEKMRRAKTPEERQALVAATRAEMENRAKEKGIMLPKHSGHHAGMNGSGKAGAAGHAH